MFGTLIQEPGTKQAHRHTGKRAAPAYLTVPNLKKVQEKFEQGANEVEIARVIAGLDSIYPLDSLYSPETSPGAFLVEAVNKWIQSIFPPQLCEELDISITLEEYRYACWESGENAPEHSLTFTFSLGNFLNEYFPLGEVLETYEKQSPGLGCHLLRLLSICPLNIGTPENMYEMNSYFYWYGEDTEKMAFNERYEEYLASCEDEEDEDSIRDYVRECIIGFTFEQFESCLPGWTFKRELCNVEYKGPIPEELRKLEDTFQAYSALKKCHYEFPNTNLPGCIVPLDQNSYDFFCDVLNNAGDDLMQYGEDYYFSGLHWILDSTRTPRLCKTLTEIQCVLRFFSACMEFLLQYQREYPENA
ncbi:MAG: hypothetical protein WC082_02290 [Victivallales bacterium]|nr:hypothetical protein [Victivallaceae bacterium]